MERTALFAGSFDPITAGHEALVRRALPLFDRIVVAIGENTQKQSRYTLSQRKEWISRTFADCPTVAVDSYSGLTADYCRCHGIGYLLRGLRGGSDFAYEETIALTNRLVAPDIETLFLLSETQYNAISSSMVRELLIFGHDVADYLPAAIREDFATLHR